MNNKILNNDIDINTINNNLIFYKQKKIIKYKYNRYNNILI